MHRLGLFLVQAILWITSNTLPSGGILHSYGPSLTCATNPVTEEWRGWSQLGRKYTPDFSINQVCNFDYDTLQAERSTMGCVCRSEGPDGRRIEPQPFCYRGLANSSIYDNVYLRRLCSGFCGCPYKGPVDQGKQIYESTRMQSHAESAASSNEQIEDTGTSGLRNIEDVVVNGNTLTSCSISGATECDESQPVDIIDFPYSFNSYSSPAVQTSPEFCGVRCENFRCANRASGCRCIASQVVNMRKYVGSCAIISNGKRDEVEGPPIACPCNGTYITRACCDVDNGIVHEDGSNNLGSMIDEKDVYDLAVEAFALLRNSFFPESQEVAISASIPVSTDTIRARSEEESVAKLECGNDLPVPIPLPYTSLSDLCGHHQSKASTLGCHCSVINDTSTMNCSAPLASPALYNTPLLALCQTKCFCSSGPLAKADKPFNVTADYEVLLMLLEARNKKPLVLEHLEKSEEEIISTEPDLSHGSEEVRDLKKRDATTEAEKSEHGQGLSGNTDQVTPHSHIEQTVLSVGCLLVGVTLSIVGSALSWQEKGLRERNDFA